MRKSDIMRIPVHKFKENRNQKPNVQDAYIKKKKITKTSQDSIWNKHIGIVVYSFLATCTLYCFHY